MRFMFYTPLCSDFSSLFLKNCFPPSLGSVILKIAVMQNHAKKTFSGPPIARFTPMLGLFWCIFPLSPPPCLASLIWKNVAKTCMGSTSFFFRLCLGASLSFLSKSLQNSLFFHLCLLFRWLFDRISLNFRWSYTCFLKKVLPALAGEHNFGVGIRALRVRKTLILHRFGFETPS